jgi:hypothetical protein
MGLIITDNTHYGDIADAIRAKVGGSDTYKPEDMAAAIEAIPSGGGGKFAERLSAEAATPYDVTAADLADVPKLKICAFYYDLGLRSIVIPSTTTLGKNNFYHCENLQSVTFQGAIEGYDGYNISDYMGLFQHCHALRTVDVPVNIAKTNYGIFIYMFANCTALTTARFTLTGDVDGQFGMNNTFYYCSALTYVDIVISGNATIYFQSVFQYCSSLTKLTLPDKMTSLGGDNFNGCTKLEFLDMGTGFDSCTAYACKFGNTNTGTQSETGLHVIIRRTSSVVTLNNANMFGYTPTDKPSNFAGFYVPDALVDSYKAAQYWSTWANYIHPLSDLD